MKSSLKTQSIRNYFEQFNLETKREEKMNVVALNLGEETNGRVVVFQQEMAGQSSPGAAKNKSADHKIKKIRIRSGNG